jgi:hypothetical protein
MNANAISTSGPQPAAGKGIIALKKFTRDVGISAVTAWRWRKQGWLQVVNIAGRPYLTAEGLAEFQRRAVAGEFAQEHKVPRVAAA